MKVKMNDIKIITFFHKNEHIPFMTCMVKNVEEHEQGVDLIFEKVIASMLKITILFSCLNQRMIATRKEWLMYVGD